MNAKTRALLVTAALAAVTWTVPSAASDATKLYGIHWWGHTADQNGNLTVSLDTAPRDMLDVGAGGQSAWDTETALTHSDWWWSGQYLTGLYNQIRAWNVTPITRVDYTWNDTVPAPTDANYAGWPLTVRVQIVDVLKPWTRFWVIGNEPNLLMAAGSLWPNRQIQPADYATIYRNVRNEIQNNSPTGPEGAHIVLVAGPSPGPVAGDRWMAGTDYLDQVLANIPAGEVDGIAIHGYAGDINTFRNDYQSQLQVIDNRGLGSKPVWITEFNRWTDTNNCNDEATSAQFIRDSFADVNSWNSTTGNHNIIGMTWFVYDKDQVAANAWNNYSIEHWKNTCLTGSSDMYQAFSETVDLRYNAGVWGGGGGAPQDENLALKAVTYNVCGYTGVNESGLKARDGATSTKWACFHNGIWTAGDHWLAYDLGSSATVKKYVVQHASTGGETIDYNTDKFYIESASALTQTTWTQEFYVDNACSKVSSNTLTYGTPKTLRYVRIRVTKPNCSADWAVRIPEVEVWGNPAAAQVIRFQAEDYDGGANAASGTDYYDTTSGNTGGKYRTQDVDIENCSEGGYNVGWMAAGEWLDFAFYGGGDYDFRARVATPQNSKSFHVEVDGVNVTGTINVPNTGGWQTWTTTAIKSINNLSWGNHELRLKADTNNFNWNWVEVIPGAKFQAEDYTGGSSAQQNVDYYDTTTGNSGGQYRTQDVDIEATSDTGGGYNVGWVVAGEWLRYFFDSGGKYQVILRTATPYAGLSCHIEVDGVNASGSIAIPQTGGWQTWTTVNGPTISMSNGSHTVKFVADSHNFNINWFCIGPSR